MRRYKFQDVPNLDTELDLIVQSLTELTGKKISEFPPLSQTPELSRFIKKISSTQYEEYIKIDGAFRLLGGGGSGDAYIEMRVSEGYIQWRDDPAGAWINLIAIADLQGPPGPPGTIADGDKGDITVASGGTIMTINNNKVTEAKLNLSDNTTGNVNTARHGLIPKLPNDANKFFNGVGQWVDLTVIVTVASLIVLGCNNYGIEVIDFVDGIIIS